MKTLTVIAFIVLGIVSPLLAEKPLAQSRIVVSYEGIDMKWFSDIKPEVVAAMQREDGVIATPSVTALVGKVGSMEIAREYRTRRDSPGDPVILCGIINALTSELKDDKILVYGTCVIRRSTNLDSEGVATNFQSIEVLVDLELNDKESKSIELMDGGKISISAILIDPTGQPMNK